MSITLRRPSSRYSRQVMDFREELKKNGNEFDGCAGLEDCVSFEEWIRFEERLKAKYREGYVPSEVFLAVRESDDRLVGIIDYRHPLTDFLMNFGGNIGYSVRPSERQKGYASEMLRMMLEICRSYGEKQVLLTCDRENIASRKTIMANGGVLENEIEDVVGLSKSGRIQRYWISTGGGKEAMPETFDLNGYLKSLISECGSAFGERLLYIGLQGSYLRGEANENSDIDVMAVIDHFSVKDMDTYRAILEKIGYSEKACGFICGREEMMRWSPLEVCQLQHTTKDLFGSLTDFLPSASRTDEINYVKFSLGNLYHELCHRYIHADHEKNVLRFRGTCKGLFFLIQNIYYLESGRFVTTKRELKEQVSEEDRRMLSMADLPDDYDFDSAFLSVFRWCQTAFIRMDQIK